MPNEMLKLLNKTHIHCQILKIMVLVGWGAEVMTWHAFFRQFGKPTNPICTILRGISDLKWTQNINYLPKIEM